MKEPDLDKELVYLLIFIGAFFASMFGIIMYSILKGVLG